MENRYLLIRLGKTQALPDRLTSSEKKGTKIISCLLAWLLLNVHRLRSGAKQNNTIREGKIVADDSADTGTSMALWILS